MPDTVTSLIEQAIAAIAALDGKVTSLDAKVTALTAADTAGMGGVRQLISDTQAAVLHVQDTLGHPNA